MTMEDSDELQAARLLEQFLEATARGEQPDLDEYLRACPPSEREALRLAIKGAVFLDANHPDMVVSDETVAAVQSDIARSARVRELADAARQYVAAVARLGALTIDTMKSLASEVLSIRLTPGQEETDRAPIVASVGRRGLRSRACTRYIDHPWIGIDAAQRGQEEASQVLAAAGGLSTPTDLQGIARWLGALIVSEAMDDADGCVAMDERSAVVFANARIDHVGRRRFAVAHELGHVALHRDEIRFKAEALAEIEDYGGPDCEAEANGFATELLMPQELVTEDIGEDEPCLELAQAIEEDYQTSLTAAAVRLVELSDHPSAVVFSKDGDIQWFVSSSTFAHDIARGRQLDPITEAYALHGGREADRDFVEVALAACTTTTEGQAMEQSWPSESGNVLTLLRHSAAEEP